MSATTEPSGFKFEPRAFSATPRQFGKSSKPLRPAAGYSESDLRFVAAQLQHRVANVVREELLDVPMTLEGFVNSLRPPPPGMTYDRLVRIQRGETLMQIADLMNWAQQFSAIRALLADEQSWMPVDRVDPPLEVTLER
ncbi:hypothetical protein E3T54_13160 [Cryobacterium sp. Sr8]|uniref:hypothetical protein n=1 Tax=Cryobacterium sp. Sr8 TaxID=1259203 RepID=UPI00106AE8E2|nr:hypothetical protein [Cryobacterium sp. Sr8]TFD74892.1 hypothetical protein E3T54_13160 [Cryobacterium sp. Sr8]